MTVRMYNVGFGDCFLLTFPAKSGKSVSMLIDCGSHAAGPGPHSIEEVVRRVIADVSQKGKPTIDVVVATHRHRDHVLGFESGLWNNVEVGEVWMPWTEDPTDAEARKILETQSRIAQKLMLAAPHLGVEVSKTVQDLANNSFRNELAMKTLHDGFAGSPVRRYLPWKYSQRANLTLDSVPGLLVHILGPARDPDIIRDMQPPKGMHYLSAAANESSGAAPSLPFSDRWGIDRQRFTEMGGSRISSTTMTAVARASRIDELAIATSLESAVNGTSLVLMFQLGRAYMLFPGDAQWGTWNRIMTDPTTRLLLSKTTFLKIGHHGSHNATPRPLIERIIEVPVPSMISTRKMKMWPEIPKRKLLLAMQKRKYTVIRSDRKDASEQLAVARDAYSATIRVPF